MNIFKENKDVDNNKIHRAKYRRLQRHNIRLYEQKQFHNIERLRHEKVCCETGWDSFSLSL